MKIYSVLSFSLFFLLITGTSTAQLQSYKKGLASFDRGYYDLAVKELLKVKEIDRSQQANLNYKIAESYRLSNRWIESISYYKDAIELGIDDQDAVFHYGYALKANEQYEEALAQFRKYIELKTANRVYNEWANREINTLQIVELLKEKNSGLLFRNLKEINTTGAEFSPVIYEGHLVFSSSRKDKVYSNGLPFLGIYKAKINGDLTSVGEVNVFSDKIFDSERNEGSPAFSPDGKIVVFARGNSGKRKDFSPDVDLYMSRKTPQGWSDPVVVSASDSLSWDGSPAFSGDGKTLYFASNRAGGSGGMDIYRVNMDASGRFGTPTNMGKTLNTPGNEMFPYVTNDGKLYFSSDGHPGLGKLDLFVAERKGGKITVENMGIPFNSAMDDFGLTADENGNLFFSSNRRGGQGDDDIYFYQAPPKADGGETEDPLAGKEKEGGEPEDTKVVNYYLKGTILDKEESQILAGVKLGIYKIEEGFQELIQEITTDASGVFGPLALEEETDYLLIAEKPDYLIRREGFSMYGRSIPQILLRKPVTDTTFTTTISLEKVFVGKTFRLENIYYDLDKADIRPDAAIELDKLVQILLDNPKLRIELGSHTDVRGSDMYNLRLSQRRADSAIAYLISRGISRDRLTATGYGETELIVDNAKTEEEHQINRRTEFKILAIDSGEVQE
jgi:peptidoglycan-associated lipoprotein